MVYILFYGGIFIQTCGGGGVSFDGGDSGGGGGGVSCDGGDSGGGGEGGGAGVVVAQLLSFPLITSLVHVKAHCPCIH